MKDFANILFSGPCNRACPFCIGKQLPAVVNENNLKRFPLTNIDGFIDRINHFQIKQLVFTGTISDPQLYKYQQELIDYMRERISYPVTFSIHSNGALTLKQIDTFNHYDKSALSFPSFVPDTYHKMMGGSPPDLAAIVKAATIEVKVSAIINQHNLHEIDDFIARCADIGIKRLVLRKLFNETRDWPILQQYEPDYTYRSNPVYTIKGMQVTYWNFNSTESTSINLFPNGMIGEEYLLTEAEGLQTTA